MQAPAPARLMEGGLATDAAVAQVLVSKYADTYRSIDRRRSMSARGRSRALHVGRLGRPRGVHLRPVYNRLFEVLKESGKLFADDTTAPGSIPGVSAPRPVNSGPMPGDDRPWAGGDPPGVAYVYAPDRKAERPSMDLIGFKGVFQVDGYAGYRPFAESGDVNLAFCPKRDRFNQSWPAAIPVRNVTSTTSPG